MTTAYRRAYDAERRVRIRAAGTCLTCRGPRGERGTHDRCRPCADAQSAQALARYYARKATAIEAAR